MGIRAKLVLCLLSVLIPLIAASAFAIHLFDRQLSQRIESSLLNTERLEAARIKEILNEYRKDAKSLAMGAHVKSFVGDLVKYRGGNLPDDHIIGGIDGFAIVNPDSKWPLQQLALGLQRKANTLGSNIVELRLVDLQQNVLGESTGFSWQPIDPQLINSVIGLSETRFGNAFRNSENKDRLGLVSPIFGQQGETVGALVLETRLGPVVDLVAEHEGVGYSSEAHIAQPTPNGDAMFITELRFDRDAAFNRVVPRETGLPINLSLESPTPTVLQARDYRDVHSVLAVETLPETKWGLVVKIDSAEAFQAIAKLRKTMAIAVLASIACVLLGYLFCLHPIARRLQRNALAAQQVMAGNLKTPIDDPVADEIGEAARSIDRLARDLDADRRKRSIIEDRLRHQALHDDLTGLYNRKHANAIIRSLSIHSVSIHSVMFLDLDGFKGVNDLFGHAIGDEVLVAIADRLSKKVSGDITLARWGGDEFVIILPETGNSDAADFAVEIQSLFETPVISSLTTHKLGCSIGLATSADDRTLAEVLIDADTLMYEQKKQRHATSTMSTMATQTVQRALHENRVEVWYQPIVSFARPGELQLIGAEALVRLRTRDGGIIMPDDFLPEVRRHVLGLELDKRIVGLGLKAMARWRTAGVIPDNFRLSINLTGESLRDKGIVPMLEQQLTDLKLTSAQLLIEISEDTDLLDQAVITQIKNAGIQLALDDVGLHRSNLDRLVGLEPHSAKIDRRWLDDQVVLPLLVELCQSLGIEPVAEGVESHEQLAQLHQLSVNCFQGYLFDRPSRAVNFISRWGSSHVATLDNSTVKQRGWPLAV